MKRVLLLLASLGLLAITHEILQDYARRQFISIFNSTYRAIFSESLGYLQEFLSERSESHSPTQRVIASNEHLFWVHPTLQVVYLPVVLPPISGSIVEYASGLNRLTDPESILLGTILQDVQEGSFFLVASPSQHERAILLAGLNALWLKLALVVTAIFFFGILALLLWWRRFTRELRLVQKRIKAFSSGDASVRLEASRIEEVDVVSRAFNAIAERLEQAWGALRREEDVRAQLSYGLIHDLRTPLASLRWAAQLVERELKPKEQQDGASTYRDVLTQSLSKLRQLSTQLVQYLLLSPSAQRVALQVADVREVARQAFAVCNGRAEEAGVSLVAVIPEVGDWSIAHDELELQRALVNLLDNAIRYSDRGAVVKLVLSAEVEQVRIEVQDFGAGIASNDQERILKPFEQGAGADIKQGNIGLGLAFVSRVIASHGGRLTLVSEVGVGSTFSILLPREKTHAHGAIPVGDSARAPQRKVQTDTPFLFEVYILLVLLLLGMAVVFVGAPIAVVTAVVSLVLIQLHSCRMKSGSEKVALNLLQMGTIAALVFVTPQAEIVAMLGIVAAPVALRPLGVSGRALRYLVSALWSITLCLGTVHAGIFLVSVLVGLLLAITPIALECLREFRRIGIRMSAVLFLSASYALLVTILLLGMQLTTTFEQALTSRAKSFTEHQATFHQAHLLTHNHVSELLSRYHWMYPLFDYWLVDNKGYSAFNNFSWVGQLVGGDEAGRDQVLPQAAKRFGIREMSIVTLNEQLHSALLPNRAKLVVTLGDYPFTILSRIYHYAVVTSIPVAILQVVVPFFGLALVFHGGIGREVRRLSRGLQRYSAGNYDTSLSMAGDGVLREVAQEIDALAVEIPKLTAQLERSIALRRSIVEGTSQQLDCAIKSMEENLYWTEQGRAREALHEIVFECEQLDMLFRLLLQNYKVEETSQEIVDEFFVSEMVEELVAIARSKGLELSASVSASAADRSVACDSQLFADAILLILDQLNRIAVELSIVFDDSGQLILEGKIGHSSTASPLKKQALAREPALRAILQAFSRAAESSIAVNEEFVRVSIKFT